MSRVKQLCIGVVLFLVGILAVTVVLFLEKSAPHFPTGSVEVVPDALFTDGIGSFPKPEPRLRSRAAVLFDYDSGTLLFEKNGNLSLPPASMTKLMTLHLAYRAVEEGRIGLNEEVVVDGSGDFHSQPRGSSLMFLEEGQRVTVNELMKGLAVPSGNDAAVALALAVEGSVERFVAAMNEEARRLGLSRLHFADPAGISPENRITALDFGRFCMEYIRSHPISLSKLHSLRTLAYPQEHNLPPHGGSSYGTIEQENYNLLVGRLPSVDGLKTGYIDESGYNIALTAERDGRRLVAVLLGGPGDGTREGNLTRVIDGTNLLSYGFYAYRRVQPELKIIEPPRVWGGKKDSVLPVLPELEEMVLPAVLAASLQAELELNEPLKAPIHTGQRLGEVLLKAAGEEVARYPLVSAETVEAAGIFGRIKDGLLLRY